MNKNNLQAYGQLCSLFYDTTEQYASEQEVHFFATCIERNPGRVLEAMSGSGRLQIPLMQRGYVIDGVDISYAMFERCRQRCATFGLKPDLYEQSLENMALPHIYSTVIIAVGSLQLITDQNICLKSLRNLHAHMMPGGNLFIDIFVPDHTLDPISISIARLNECSTIRLTRRHMFDMQKKIATTFCLYELIVNGLVTKQENELVEVFWLSDDAWKELLHNAGFAVITTYDEQFKQSESSRVIHAKSMIR